MIRMFSKLSALSFLVTLAACGNGSETSQSREKAMEDTAKKYGIDADVSVDESGDVEQVVINSGSSQVGQNLNLPDGFPDDISLPADWNIMASAPVPNGFSVQAISEDNADGIVAALRTKLSSDGWEEVGFEQPAPQMSQIGFEKDNRMANFNIMANGETHLVQLMTMVKP